VIQEQGSQTYGKSFSGRLGDTGEKSEARNSKFETISKFKFSIIFSPITVSMFWYSDFGFDRRPEVPVAHQTARP
jgi:hypothetical protein